MYNPQDLTPQGSVKRANLKPDKPFPEHEESKDDKPLKKRNEVEGLIIVWSVSLLLCFAFV